MRRFFALLFLTTALWSGFWGLGMLLHKPDNSALLVGVILCGGALGALAVAASIAFPRKDAAHGDGDEVENPARRGARPSALRR